MLTAALLRHLGFHARLILGVVLVGVHSEQQGSEPPGSELRAFGHAWVEVHDGGAWHIVDAALHVSEVPTEADKRQVGVPGLPDNVTLRVAYLPVNVMENEGPGYSGALIGQVGVYHIVRLKVDTARSGSGPTCK